MLTKSEIIRKIERHFHAKFDANLRVYIFRFGFEFAVSEVLMNEQPILATDAGIFRQILRLAKNLRHDKEFLIELQKEANNAKSTT